MKIVNASLTKKELKKIAAETFGDMVKAVVDVERGLLALDADLHADLEAMLLADGSAQKNLWGINFYPDLDGEDWIEFDSMINLRPSQGNQSRGVESADLQAKIRQVVGQWVTP